MACHSLRFLINSQSNSKFNTNSNSNANSMVRDSLLFLAFNFIGIRTTSKQFFPVSAFSHENANEIVCLLVIITKKIRFSYLWVRSSFNFYNHYTSVAMITKHVSRKCSLDLSATRRFQLIQFHVFSFTLYVDQESAFKSCSADQQVQFCLSCYIECIFYYYLS